MSNSRYFLERDQKNEEKLKQLIVMLPACCKDFFRGISSSTTSMTQLAYAYDLTMFFNFLMAKSVDEDASITDYKASITLASITQRDIERYLEYLSGDSMPSEAGPKNQEQGIRRRLSSLKSFFGYFYNSGVLSSNPALSVRMPKIREKEIVRLSQNEMKSFLQELEDGAGLTGKQNAYHKTFKSRDVAMLSLMLGTGIRVSECVGLDITDIDLTDNGAHIRRKGGKEAVVYFNDDVARKLQVYLADRQLQKTEPGHEEALFLSRRNRRISVRGVENLVKKYASYVTPNKHITPHKLRSSYGTALYTKTGDIYLVGSILGHKNINVTTRFYTDVEEKKKMSVKHIDLLN